MKAVEASLLSLLKQSPQFIIPIYQRTYSWSDRECKQLWSDVLRAGRNDKVADHFVGSIVYIAQGLSQVTVQSPLLVIDGQQRLTTVALLLEALARQLGDTEPTDGCSAEKIRSYYLLNPLEKEGRRFKVLLTQTDRNTLNALVQQQPLPDERSVRIEQNFELFVNLVGSLGAEGLIHLWSGLTKLIAVDVSLNRDEDNPQLIFESMNSTGRELSQADLIRNFVLMGLEPDHQTQLYESHWRPMEVRFDQEAYGAYFDGFVRHFLTVKTGEIPNVKAVYEAFKAYSRTPEIVSAGVDELVRDIERFGTYYCAMAFGKEQDKELGEAFLDLRELRVDVAYPLLLELYHDYATGVLSQPDFVQILRQIESYVFRRAICAIPTNSLNKTFSTFSRSLRKTSYLESATAAFILMPSYRRIPSDEEFQRELMTRDLYNFPRCSYYLRRLENQGRKERVAVEDYSIEHILPQNKDLSSDWRNALGPDWKGVQERRLHTLGNLTLTGYNSEYSDRPFEEKRDMGGGFAQSPLHLNQGLGEVIVWDESEIEKRAERLATQAVTVWKIEELPENVLDSYRSSGESRTTYTIEDHPNLVLIAPIRTLFDALRKELLAMDPCVSEEFLKQYVAYKAETNFVDVIAQSNRLVLILNMAFPELRDPRRIAKDITHVGRWGNGDVEVALTATSEIPYVVGLIRQSFEKQMGSGEVSDS
jgi:uncharacterized protein with ParB-like and HNH nuclease domain/predicted transport protein